MADFVFTQNDVLPEVEFTLADKNGPVNLTFISSIRFWYRRDKVGAVAVEREVTVTSASSGQVKVKFHATDTVAEGEFLGQFRVVWPGNEPESFPNSRFISFTIKPAVTTVP